MVNAIAIPIIAALLVIVLIRTLQNRELVKQHQLPVWVSSKNVSLVIVNFTYFIVSAIFLIAYAASIHLQMPGFATIITGYVALGTVVFTASTILPSIALADVAGHYPQNTAVDMRKRVEKVLFLQLPEVILFLTGVGLTKIVYPDLTALSILFAVGLVLINWCLLILSLFKRNTYYKIAWCTILTSLVILLSCSPKVMMPGVYFYLTLTFFFVSDILTIVHKAKVSTRCTYHLTFFSWLAITWNC